MDKQLHFNALISSDIGGHVRNRFSSFEERGLNRNTSALIVSLQALANCVERDGHFIARVKIAIDLAGNFGDLFALWAFVVAARLQYFLKL